MKYKIKWNHILRESPQIVVDEVNDDYVEKYLHNPIKLAIADKKIIPTDDPEIFQIPKLFEATFFYYKDETIVAAVDFESHTTKGKKFLIPSLIKKFETDHPNVLHKMYMMASKHFNAYIMSGYRQTMNSFSIWKKFFDDPEKYGIKEIYTIPEGLTKHDDIWGDDKSYREVRIVIKF
jgi:hypothetical protein